MTLFRALGDALPRDPTTPTACCKFTAWRACALASVVACYSVHVALHRDLLQERELRHPVSPRRIVEVGQETVKVTERGFRLVQICIVRDLYPHEASVETWTEVK